MCGIVGYIGKQKAAPILIDGLKALEYRGYDSAGLALREPDGVKSVKSVGKVINLENKAKELNFNGQLGIAHTRWATHGGVLRGRDVDKPRNLAKSVTVE